MIGFRNAEDTAATGWWQFFIDPRPTLDNFAQGADILNLQDSLPSTLAMAIPASLLTILLSAYGGYVLAVHRFRGQTIVYGVLIALLAVPPQLTFVPLISLFSTLHLSGSIVTVWLFQAGFTIPFGVYLLRGYAFTIPHELLEAARVDGASELRIFLQVFLPLTTPVLAALGILQFMWSWNDLLTPLIFIGTTSSAAPITLQLAGLTQSLGVANAMNQVAAGSVIAILPPVIVILALQRYFIAGITGGAVKG